MYVSAPFFLRQLGLLIEERGDVQNWVMLKKGTAGTEHSTDSSVCLDGQVRMSDS